MYGVKFIFLTILLLMVCPVLSFAKGDTEHDHLKKEIRIIDSQEKEIIVSSEDIRHRLLSGKEIYFVDDQEEKNKIIKSDLIIEALKSTAKRIDIRNAIIVGDLNWADGAVGYVPVKDFPVDLNVVRDSQLFFFGVEGFNIISKPITIVHCRFRGEIKSPEFNPIKGKGRRIAAFIDTVHILNCVFEKTVDFSGAYFSYANFANTTFQELARFLRTQFQFSAVFDSTVFDKEAMFLYAIFGYTRNPSRMADFHRATFKGRTFFEEANFQNEADFSEAQFKDTVNFRDVVFNNSANFLGASFSKNVDFYQAIYTTLLINWSQLEGRLDSALNDVLINLKKVNRELREKNITLNDYLKDDQGKRQMLSKNIIVIWDNVYLRLIKNFDDIGDHESAVNAYYYYRSHKPHFRIVEEDNILRRGAWEKIKEWGGYIILGLTCGYGVKYWRPAIVGVIIIMIFSFIYFGFQGTRIGSLEYQDDKKDFSRDPIYYRMFNSLYFSVITFTTIGYGDLLPNGAFKIFAMLEGLLGWLTMALFLVTLANVWLK